MTSSVVILLKSIVFIAIFIFELSRIAKANKEREHRYLQFPMPFFSLIYVIVVMTQVERIKSLIVKFFAAIPKWINQLASASWMNDSVGKFLYKVENFFENIANAIVNSFILFALANIVILLLFIIFKKICIAILNKVEKASQEQEALTGEDFKEYLLVIYARIRNWFRDKLYEQYGNKNNWVLKDEYGHLRLYLKVFYFALLVLVLAIIPASENLMARKLIASRYMPAYLMILFGEILFVFNGLLKEEFIAKLKAEEDHSRRVDNLYYLRIFFRSIFPDKLIMESTVSEKNVDSKVYDPRIFVDDTTHEDIFESLRISNDPKEVAFGKYYEKINSEGVEIKHNYLKASLKLLNGESVLFNNPFYRDFSPYVFYPMNRVLLHNKKVLVVLGRHAIESDIKEWIIEGLTDITSIPTMWKVGVLGEKEEDLDVGIVTRSNVHNLKMHIANDKFFKNVDYFVIIEPSKLVSTGQIGLSSLVKRCKNNTERNITFCSFDKNCDGLVDTMSHILMTNIDYVSPLDKHQGEFSYMAWKTTDENLQHRLFHKEQPYHHMQNMYDPNFVELEKNSINVDTSNVSRYLGIGTELSFAGLKNQVATTEWYGGDVFPVKDMKWIDRQYYYPLMNYADLPAKQELLDEVFKTTPNYWSAKKKETNYLTVEDEPYNLYEVLRNFATRGTKESFVHIISSDYMFKEYMGCNFSLFETDAKAIPCLAPDYVRSGRNIALKLLLILSSGKVAEKVIEKELNIIGIKTSGQYSIKEQLWNEIYSCFTSAKDIDSTSGYEEIVKGSLDKYINFDDGEQFNISIIKESREYNPELDQYETLYYIDDKDMIERCIQELKSASYVTEDEVNQKHFLGSELYGQIFQKLLPGQFFTFDGKYYEMQAITGNNDVLVRRAADHITGRPMYRQIRKYLLENTKVSSEMGAVKNIDGFVISHAFSDITVSTDAYYRMKNYDDFETAKKVTVSNIPKRIYKNKSILKIQLPGEISEKVKYTLTVLLNESFRTLFAENQEYIVALTSFDKEANGESPLTYSIDIDGESEKNCVYIVEDSQLDLGILNAVERNLRRILETIFDYLNWHNEWLECSSMADVVAEMINETELEELKKDMDENEKAKKEKKGGLWKKIKKLFGKKDKKEEDTDKDEKEKPSDNSDNTENVDDKPDNGQEPKEESADNGEEPKEENADDGEKPIEESADNSEKPIEEKGESVE